MIDTSSHRDAGSAGAGFRTTNDPAAGGLTDGPYYLCLTDSLIRRDQLYAFDNSRGRDQPVCRVFWKANR